MKKNLIMMLAIAAMSMVWLGGCNDPVAPKDNPTVNTIYTYLTNYYTIKSNITDINVLVQKDYVTNIQNLAHYSQFGGTYFYKFSDVDLKHYWATCSTSPISGGSLSTVLSTNDGYYSIGNANAGPISGNIRVMITFPKELIITNYSIVKK